MTRPGGERGGGSIPVSPTLEAGVFNVWSNRQFGPTKPPRTFEIHTDVKLLRSFASINVRVSLRALAKSFTHKWTGGQTDGLMDRRKNV